MKVGDLVCPRTCRRAHWIGLAIDQRPSENEECPDALDFLIQWTCNPKGPAWWIDWSLEVVNESR